MAGFRARASSRRRTAVRSYFGGTCYSCGEVGHRARNCKADIAGKRLGPCYNCGLMGHLLRECPAMQVNEIENDDREFPRKIEQRNWADLHPDVLSMIFNKITSVDIIRSAQYVCRPWRQLSYEPEVWRHIAVTMPEDYMDMSALESLAMLALDRSQGYVEDFHLLSFRGTADELFAYMSDRSPGCVEEFHLQNFWSDTDELIAYMSDRTSKLWHLRLISISKMSLTTLAQAIRKFPLLEELEITFCLFSSKLIEVVGQACLQLKSFKLNLHPAQLIYDYDINLEAFSIAKHMQQLQRLDLFGNRLSNKGLLTILNSCPNLQCLDIRECFYVSFDENLRRACAKIKELRLS